MHISDNQGYLNVSPSMPSKRFQIPAQVSNEIPEWQHPEYRFYISKKSVPIEKSPCCERKSITCLRD